MSEKRQELARSRCQRSQRSMSHKTVRGKVLGCGKLQDPDELQRSHVTQVAGLQPDDEVLKNLGTLSKWVLWVWFSLLRSLEVKEKEAEDNLALTTNKVESKGRKAQSW